MKVKIYYKHARKGMRQRYRRAEDFRVVFRWARRELEVANAANFASQGSASGRPWMPLDDEYARWKLEHYGPLPILIQTGTLAESLVRLRGRPNEINRKSAVFGTSVKHAKYHQYGTRHMPERKVAFTPPLFLRRVGKKMAEHFVHGNIR